MLFFQRNNIYKLLTIIILLFINLIINNCERDFSSLQLEQEILSNLELKVEKVRVKEVWLSLKMKELTNQICVYRDSIRIFEGKINTHDTVIYDYNLLPKHEYSYIAYQIQNDTISDSSLSINVTTKDYEWNFLGLPDTFTVQLKISEPYLYACASIYGLWRTTLLNPQMNWEYLGLSDTISSAYATRGVRDVLIHPTNSNVLLVGTAPEQADRHSIYKSIDGGNTWMNSDSGLGWVYGNYDPVYPSIYRFVVCPNHILAGGAGLCFSVNFGEFWEYTPEGFGYIDAIENHPKLPNIVWAGGEDLVSQPLLFYSVNSGLNWTFVDITPIVGWIASVVSIGLDPIDENTVYVRARGLLKSVDGGNNWSTILNEYVREILIDSYNNRHIRIASRGSELCESWDGGETWTILEDPIPQDAYITDMIWHENTETIYIATLRGVYSLIP
jgi:hypothetical protein